MWYGMVIRLIMVINRRRGKRKEKRSSQIGRVCLWFFHTRPYILIYIVCILLREHRHTGLPWICIQYWMVHVKIQCGFTLSIETLHELFELRNRKNEKEQTEFHLISFQLTSSSHIDKIFVFDWASVSFFNIKFTLNNYKIT